MQRDSRGMRAETVQIESLNSAARGLANARYEYCVNSGRWVNQGQSMEQFCKAYAFAPQSLASSSVRGLANVSRVASSGLSAKGSVPQVQQQPFAQNPMALRKGLSGRVQRIV